MTKQLFYLNYRIFINQIRWNDFFTSCFFTCCIIQGCSAPLGMQNGKIPDAQITASSNYYYTPPHFGRLHRQLTNTYVSAWCSQGDNLIGGFLQIDLGSIKWVTKIATQGRVHSISMWVTGYTLSFSNTTDTWEDYRGDQNCITVRTKQKRNVCVFIP